MKRLFTALLMLAILGMSCEAFATAVTFENLHYGQDAFELHVNDQPNFIVFEGEEYSLNDNAASYTGKAETYGGKTRAVYEMTVPADGYAAADSGEAAVLGEWVISIPYRAQLWVAQGNRVTGEYVVDGPIDLTEPYREEIVIPRDENGDPLLIDKIYLYSYQQGDETQRYAASLYIDYENYIAARPVPAAAKRSVPSGKAVPVVIVGVACAALAAGVVVAVKRKKRKSTAVAPAAPEECDLMAQGCEMLEQLKEESKGLQDAAVSEKAALLCRLLNQQLDTSKENPQRLSGMRKVITYYLPVALKLLKFWRSNEQQDVDEDKRADAFASVAGGLDMIIDAFRKKLNNLHDAEMMDVSAELSALDQMLKREGLKDHRLKLTLGETKKD